MRNKNKRHQRGIPDSEALIAHLRSKGWTVSTYDKRTEIRSGFFDDYEPFVEIVEECINPQGTVWFVCARHFDANVDTAYLWNEWEKLSLEARPEDSISIEEFWITHIPIIMSVKDGVHSVFAINVENHDIHFGQDQEVEDPQNVSDNVAEFFEMIIEGTLPPLAQQIFE